MASVSFLTAPQLALPPHVSSLTRALEALTLLLTFSPTLSLTVSLSLDLPLTRPR